MEEKVCKDCDSNDKEKGTDSIGWCIQKNISVKDDDRACHLHEKFYK